MRKILIAATLALIGAPALAQPNEGRFLERLSQSDANGDGAVARDEFLAARADQFGTLDSNGDGVITSSERPRLASMLEQFDVNGDDSIDQNEFVNGPTPLFEKIDANHDGAVSPDEFQNAKAQVKANR